MKTFAHRGWSEGVEENTISAFQKALDKSIDGVEFDVRYGADGKTVVLSHDPATNSAVVTLEEALEYLSSTNLELLIELKEYTDDLYVSVVQYLRKHKLVERATLFAFPHVAEKFPWRFRYDIKLGIITPYPRDIKKYILRFEPDMALMGWGTKKERLQFKTVWTFLSLKKTFAKYPTIKFVIGVAYAESDKTWLGKQSGLYGHTADMPLL